MICFDFTVIFKASVSLLLSHSLAHSLSSILSLLLFSLSVSLSLALSHSIALLFSLSHSSISHGLLLAHPFAHPLAHTLPLHTYTHNVHTCSHGLCFISLSPHGTLRPYQTFRVHLLYFDIFSLWGFVSVLMLPKCVRYHTWCDTARQNPRPVLSIFPEVAEAQHVTCNLTPAPPNFPDYIAAFWPKRNFAVKTQGLCKPPWRRDTPASSFCNQNTYWHASQ